MQYTIRNIPPALDEALRRRAAEENTSLNEVTLQALARGVGLTGEVARYRDLQDLAGTWLEDPEFEEAVAEQDGIDEELWH